MSLDGDHLAFEHGENLRQRHSAHLHVASANCSRAMRRVKSSINSFSRTVKTLDDAAFLPLEGFAFENLRDTTTQKIDPCLHVFLKPFAWPRGSASKRRPSVNLNC